MIDVARRYAELGYNVIPCGVEKRPLLGSGEVKPYQLPPSDEGYRRSDEATVTAWWEKWPDASIAICTGAASGGLIVIDIDGKDNPWPEEPDQRADLAQGCVQRTGGGGRQYFFRLPVHMAQTARNTASALAHKVDTRANGGYVIVPPSKHPSGRVYEWIEGAELDASCSELPELPAWLQKALSGVARAQNRTDEDAAKYAELMNGVGEGSRHDSCLRLAGHLLGKRLDPDIVREQMLLWNERNDPPLPTGEVEKVVNDLAARDMIKNGQADMLQEPNDDDDREMRLQVIGEEFEIPLSDITRTGGDEPFYEFVMADGMTARVAAAEMESQQQWRKQLTAAAQRVPRRTDKKGPGWDYWANSMMRAARHVEISDEDATLRGEILSWIESYFDSPGNVVLQGDEPGPYPDMPRKNVLVPGETTLCHLFTLRRWHRYIRRVMGATISMKRAAQELANIGIGRTRMRVKTETGMSNPVRFYVARSHFHIRDHHHSQEIKNLREITDLKEQAKNAGVVAHTAANTVDTKS